MKRILGILTVVALVAMTASAVEVTSENVAGVYTVALPAAGVYNLVSVNLDTFDPADQNLAGVFGDKLAKSDVPFQADQVLVYNTGTSLYDTYIQKMDGQFYSLANLGTPVNAPLVPGEAFWVKGAVGQSARELTFTGQAVETDVPQQVQIVSGYQLVGYPYSATQDANNTGLNLAAGDATDGAAPFQCDQILVYNGSTYDTYGLKTGVGWVHLTEWSVTPTIVPELPLGVGFWYNAKSGFMWTESQPYTL